MTSAYVQGFICKCASCGLGKEDAITLLLKMAESDPCLQQASEIFKDWLTTKKHTVRRGEVLSGIAKKYDVSLGDIMKENGMSSVLGLKPGMQLKIPVLTADRKNTNLQNKGTAQGKN